MRMGEVIDGQSDHRPVQQRRRVRKGPTTLQRPRYPPYHSCAYPLNFLASWAATLDEAAGSAPGQPGKAR